MNKKGQSMGSILLVFITIIVGVILFQVIAQQVGDSTNTVTVLNKVETLGANGASIYVDEYKYMDSVTIVNGTGGDTISSGNYTITNNAINPTTNALSVKITTDDAQFASESVIINATAQAPDYIGDAGGRAMAGLIVIFFALAIGVVALEPTLRSGVLNMMKR